jgi:hypothetical protein
MKLTTDWSRRTGGRSAIAIALASSVGLFGAALFPESGQAATTSLCGVPGVSGASCGTGVTATAGTPVPNEPNLFLGGGPNGTSFSASLGQNTNAVDFTLTTNVTTNPSNGFATINGLPTFQTLTLTSHVGTFTDITFGALFANNNTSGVTLTASTGANTLFSCTGDCLTTQSQGPGNDQFLLTFPALTSLVLSTNSPGFFDQIKQIQISGTGVSAVPIPGALPLFATGLAGLGLLGWRKRKKTT